MDRITESWRDAVAAAALKIATGDWMLDPGVVALRVDADLAVLAVDLLDPADLGDDHVVLRLDADLGDLDYLDVDRETGEAIDPVLTPTSARSVRDLGDQLLSKARAARRRGESG